MNPSVSLLVPVFNRADLLVPCLDSALAQTMPDLEVVVVDGASTDGTWEVCERYAAADPRVRIIREATNTGPVRGWWHSLQEARGTYATFLWSDDLISPTFLESTLAVLRGNPEVGFAFTAAEIGSAPGHGTVHYAHPQRLIPSEEFIEDSLRGADRYPVSPACALFRTSDLRQSFVMQLPEPEIDLTATGAGVDLLLFLLTALRYPWVACLPEPLAFFRSHAGSFTVNGAGGRVALGYALTRSWFARTNGHERLIGTILAQHWLHEMRASRRFVPPAAATRTYGDVVGSRGLMTAAGVHLLKSATRTRGSRRERLGARP